MLETGDRRRLRGQDIGKKKLVGTLCNPIFSLSSLTVDEGNTPDSLQTQPGFPQDPHICTDAKCISRPTDQSAGLLWKRTGPEDKRALTLSPSATLKYANTEQDLHASLHSFCLPLPLETGRHGASYVRGLLHHPHPSCLTRTTSSKSCYHCSYHSRLCHQGPEARNSHPFLPA